jgi:hypothetical protein
VLNSSDSRFGDQVYNDPPHATLPFTLASACARCLTILLYNRLRHAGFLESLVGRELFLVSADSAHLAVQFHHVDLMQSMPYLVDIYTSDTMDGWWRN